MTARKLQGPPMVIAPDGLHAIMANSGDAYSAMRVLFLVYRPGNPDDFVDGHFVNCAPIVLDVLGRLVDAAMLFEDYLGLLVLTNNEFENDRRFDQLWAEHQSLEEACEKSDGQASHRK